MLAAPPDATTIQIRLNIGQPIIDAVRRIHLKVYVDNELTGETDIAERGIPVLNFALKRKLSGPAEVRLETTPGYTAPADGRSLGVAVVGIGLL